MIFFISKLPIKYIAIIDTPSIMNAAILKVALSAISSVTFAIKYTTIGGLPIAVAPFAVPENTPP